MRYIVLSSILASLVSFLACDYFGTNALHGFFSADIFLLLIVWSLPRNLKLKIALLFVSILAAIFFNPAVGTYFAIIVLASVVSKERFFPAALIYAIIVLGVFFIDAGNFFKDTYQMSLREFWSIASYFWWGTLLFFLVPILYLALMIYFARRIFGKQKMRVHWFVCVLSVLVVALANPVLLHFQKRLSVVEFSVTKFFDKYNVRKSFDLTPGSGEGVIAEKIDEEIKVIFPIRDSYEHFEIGNKTVSILVESFGVDRDISIAQNMIVEPFKNSKVSLYGLLKRRCMFTHGAELEDFGNIGHFDTTRISLMDQLDENNVKSYYIHGYMGSFYSRNEKYPKFGFKNFWDIEQIGKPNGICDYGFKGVCDSAVISVIDSLLSDSSSKYIYWTTLDSHPPYKGGLNLSSYSSLCKRESIDEKKCIYLSLIENTLKNIASLANKHPDYKFIIRGDHRPMATVDPNQYYYGWVPFIVLN